MKYRIIQRQGGEWRIREFNGDHAEKELGEGLTLLGRTDAFNYPDGRARRFPLRPQLHRAPIFKELVGPMWDGDAIRYEDQDANDALSQ